MSVRRWSSRLAAGLVALIAAVASYSHMRAVALEYGQTDLIAMLQPLSVDGLVIVGAVAISDGRRRTWSAWLAFGVGVLASIAANVLAARPDHIARIVSAWPAVALLLVVEVISRSAPATVSGALEVPESALPDGQTVASDETAETAEFEPVKPDSEPARSRSGNAVLVMRAHRANPTVSHRELARRVGVSVATVKRYRPSPTQVDDTAVAALSVPSPN